MRASLVHEMSSGRTRPREERRTDPVRAFFDTLARGARQPLLERVSGTLRFDVASGTQVEHWHVIVDEGEVTVSTRKDRVDADAVVDVDRVSFEGMVTGRVNALAAVLRGELVPVGDLGLVLAFQRLFPGPPTEDDDAAPVAAEVVR